MHRILVVDDEEPVGKALERWLRRQRCEVRVLVDVSGGELARVLADFNPTHVISDMHMPAMTGIEVLTEVKRLAPNAVRAILSGSLRNITADQLAAIQPVRLIHKPWDNTTLARDLGLEP